MEMRWILSFAVFIVVLVQGADDHCKFQLADSKFDLRTLYRSAADGDYYGHDDSFIYHMNICGPSNAGGECQTKNGTICQYKRQSPSDNGRNITGDFLAAIATTDEKPVWSFIDVNRPDHGVTATYKKSGDTCNINGQPKPRSAVINFYCVDEVFPNPTFLVHEEDGTCVYKISFNTPEACPKTDLPAPIAPGVETKATVSNGSWWYASFEVTDADADLEINLVQTGPNASNFGDPDIYVRKGTNPTRGQYDYKAVSNNNDETLSIRKSDKDKPLSTGTYVIGVYAFGSKPVSFTLVADHFACPGNCSGHGVCVNSTCVCDTGYNVDILDDCSAKVQDIELGTTITADFHQHDTTVYYRFTVDDNSTELLQADVDWTNTNTSATLLLKKGNFPTFEDNDASDYNWYGSRSGLEVHLKGDAFTTGTYIAAVVKKKADAGKATPFTFVANAYDCPGGCNGHGTCNKVTHNCTCEKAFVGEDCSVESKDLAPGTVETATIGPYDKVYFSFTMSEPETVFLNEVVVQVICKNNDSHYPQTFLSYDKMPEARDHDYASPRPLTETTNIVVSPYALKAGRYHVLVPNQYNKPMTVAVSMTYRSTRCPPPTPSGEDSSGTSTGGVVGWCFLFLLIGGGAGFFTATNRLKGTRRHRMIDDGINADGSYDPPMIDDSNNQF